MEVNRLDFSAAFKANHDELVIVRNEPPYGFTSDIAAVG
jgi:hypothetical protein